MANIVGILGKLEICPVFPSLTNQWQTSAMMKWLITLGVAVLMPLVAMRSKAADLTVTLEGVRSAKGEVRFALFDRVDQFPRGEELVSKDIPAGLGSVTVRFRGLKPGEYAIAVHHDENDDGKMNSNFIGFPHEGFGFSNNARVIFLPPTFEAAAFKIEAEDKTVRLNVIY